MHSVCVVEPHVNYTKILTCTTILLWQIYVAGNNKIYFDLRRRVPDIFARY